MAVLVAATLPAGVKESSVLLAHPQTARQEFPTLLADHPTATSLPTVPGFTPIMTPTSIGSALLGKVTMTGDQLKGLALAVLSSSLPGTVANTLLTGFENAPTSQKTPSKIHAKKIAVQFVTETVILRLIHQLMQSIRIPSRIQLLQVQTVAMIAHAFAFHAFSGHAAHALPPDLDAHARTSNNVP